MKRKKILPFVTLALVAMIWTGCEKDYNYVTPKASSTTTGGSTKVDTVHYSTTVEPLWGNYGCTATSCHGGTIAPDLRVGSSYSGLMNKGSIDTGTPTNSDLYIRISESSSASGFMPEGGSPMSAADIQKVLTWIQQGAKNN